MAYEHILKTIIKLRFDEKAEWKRVNPVLAEREVAISKETLPNGKIQYLLYVGDGATQFNNLTPISAKIENEELKGLQTKEVSIEGGIDGHTTIEDILKYLKEEITNISLTPGPQGPQGPAGAKGEQGPVGPTGAQGERGLQGPAGEKGKDGAAGLKGDKGDIGPTGPQGEQGLVGPTGPQGEKGEQGLVGPTGPQGEKGEQGLQGPRGEQGSQGIAGPVGPTGAQGLVGPQGPQGDTGEKGEQGLVGPTGPQGERGLQGPAGVNGKDGAVGPTGPQGIQGITGPQGPQGEQGPQGADGEKGDQGLVGPTGPQGKQGPQGEQGLVGPTGPQGPVGSVGSLNKEAVDNSKNTFINNIRLEDGNLYYKERQLKVEDIEDWKTNGIPIIEFETNETFMDKKQPLTIDWPTKYDINLLKNRNTIIVLKSLKEDMQFVYKIVYTGINQIQGAYFYSGFVMKDENGFSNMGSFAIVMPKEGTGHQIIFNPFENISLQPNSTSEQGNITDGGKLTNLVINDKKYTISNAIATINGEALSTSKDFQLQTKADAQKAHNDILKELSQAMIFKGTLGTSGTITELPTAEKENCGDTYKVITAGNYGVLENVKVGDTITCAQKGEGVYEWVLIPSGDEPNGTVTNIATGEGLTGGPITTSGTITVDFNSVARSVHTHDNYAEKTSVPKIDVLTQPSISAKELCGIRLNGVEYAINLSDIMINSDVKPNAVEADGISFDGVDYYFGADLFYEEV